MCNVKTPNCFIELRLYIVSQTCSNMPRLQNGTQTLSLVVPRPLNYSLQSLHFIKFHRSNRDSCNGTSILVQSSICQRFSQHMITLCSIHWTVTSGFHLGNMTRWWQKKHALCRLISNDYRHTETENVSMETNNIPDCLTIAQYWNADIYLHGFDGTPK